MTSTDPTVGEASPAIFIGGRPPSGDDLPRIRRLCRARSASPPGTTTLGIIQPAGHTAPANGNLTRNVNVSAPDVFLVEGTGGSHTYRTPFGVGMDLQLTVRVEFEAPPPGPVDVVVSAPAGSGVLFSASQTEAGSESLVVETGFTSTSGTPLTSSFYVQGTIQGDDVDDDVPVTIDVFETTTTTPVGYEQADKPSDVDVGPSGFQFSTAADLDATTLSPDENVVVQSYLLYDSESGTLHNRRDNQQLRGGHTVTIDPSNSNPTVGDIVSPAVFSGGLSSANAVFDPLTSGTTTLEIIQPPGHTAPANGYTTRTVNVDAPDLWLYSTNRSTRISDQTLGRDLQVERRIALEAAPPAPGVDVTVTVADPSVALISTDPTAPGSASVTFPLVTSTSTPFIYVQGLTLNQGTELRITAPGYDQWITTVQVVESGFYISTPSGDFTTTTAAANTHRPDLPSFPRRPAAGRREPTGAGRGDLLDRCRLLEHFGRGDHEQPTGLHRHRGLPHHRLRSARGGNDDHLDHTAARVHAPGRRDIDRGNRQPRVGRPAVAGQGGLVSLG